MRERVNALVLMLVLLAAAPSDSPAAAPANPAEATVTETPTRVTVENESVRLVFNAAVNYVPAELVYKRGSGRNLIVDSFCLYYQYIEDGAIGSVNEGNPRGQISNGRYTVEKKDGGATVEFTGDTPHFRLTRRVTVPATGPAVKFAYVLESTKGDTLGFSLPYAPLAPRLDKVAMPVEVIGPGGARTVRFRVDDAKSPRLHTGSPYGWAQCYFSGETGEGVVFAHVREECAGGISQRGTARFGVGTKERCTFVVVPFQGDYEKALSAYVDMKTDAAPDRSNASSAVVLKRTPQWVLWADHATRKVFPQEAVPAAAPQGGEVAIEAARGEYEPFQVVLAPQKDLADVRMVLAPLTNEKGDRLAVENLKYNPVGSLRSVYDEEIPDLLLQKESVTCPKGLNTVFWVTVRVPLATPAGTYRGTLGLTSNGEKIGDVGVRLKVWDFALAETPHLCAFGNDYAYYYDSPVDLNDDAAAKGKAIKADGSEEQASHYQARLKFIGEHRFYEPSFGREISVHWMNWKKTPDGRWDFSAGMDFTAFDKAREYCYTVAHFPRFAYETQLFPYTEFINQFTFGGKNDQEYFYMDRWEPVLPKKDPKKYLPSLYDLGDDFTPEFREKYGSYVRTIAEHCRAKGFCVDENGNGPVLFIADEIPGFETKHPIVKKTIELARLVREADPRIIVVVNGRDIPDDPEILNLFDLWTARAPAATLAKLRTMGKRYGDYYMHGYFNLRDAAIAPRVQFWSYWKYDFFWIGSWAMTMQPGMRWYNRNYSNNWWFPSMQGKYGEPMSTIRFELAREGLEDHEYLWMLRDRAARMKAAPKDAAAQNLLARADALLKRAEEAAGNYTCAGDDYRFDGTLRDPTRLLALRHDIAEALEALAKAAPPKTP